MDGHRKSWMRAPIPWIAGLMTLVIVPAASADPYRDDDGGWTNHYEHDRGYGHDSRWDDPGRTYDRWGAWAGYGPYAEFSDLNGYGRWSRIPGFRDPVWFPYVAASWRPYFYGYWIDTRFGMTWVSYEPWGDVTHHYGRWVWIDHYGWGWVPGWEYGPAWVTWGVVDGYIGWAPLPPAGYRYPAACRYVPSRHHVDYRWSASFGYDSSGLDFGLWVFVSDRDFCGQSVHTHALPTSTGLSLFKEKRVLPVGRQLSVDYVQRVSPTPIRKVDVVQRTTKTTDGRTIVFHDPRGQESKIRDGRDATKRIVERADEPRSPERGRTPEVRVEKQRVETGNGRTPDKAPATVKTREPERTPATVSPRDEKGRDETPPAKVRSGSPSVREQPPAAAAPKTKAAPPAAKSGASDKGRPVTKRKG